ncbi:uncharacterized protein CDV56_106788 [Aspergillus thermomutatus]|uniref:Splicing factor U2AF 23 kDa subunit n=1 Tax=Aspergillus thermomutatus TaxID=41047 RepID=A0A397H2F1_ASPTH|nr:uncharacterized protein CDV56_106788 [Aspergillus thermomutatus]RHZ55563.1 hypothetical protein CDV56_106788 [Aspergillus thermomutatus]
MSTVILGGGIIGSSIAYYLSENVSSDEIHIVEASSQLFSAASGYAAGFLAKDWFAPALAPLGALSFNLHQSLAAKHGGAQKWGYMKGTALSLDVSAKKKGGAHGDDWLSAGTSRAETTASSSSHIHAEVPGWLTKQKEGVLEKISDDDTVAQVDPLRLSKFLLESSLSRGVRLHNPAKATSIITDQVSGTITGVRIVNLATRAECTLPCTNIIICAGPWTPQVYHDLFPSSRLSIPITSLAGYSLVIRSPRYTLEDERVTYAGRSHAVFMSHPVSSGFCPEIFSRQGGEIYIAGLNHTHIPLPAQAEDSCRIMEQKEITRLTKVAVRLMGGLTEDSVESTDNIANTNDLEILREGLCFRPVSARGVPFVARVDDDLLGELKTGSRNRTETGRGKGGVFIASGHGPWGISLSLGTGKVIAQMVKGVEPDVDIIMANYLASIFGTEQDKVNCSFYYKIGACRHGDRCSRKHVKPSYSQTILMPNMYQNPAYDPKNKMNPSQLQNHFDAFYEDVWCEMCKYGELEELVVCDNNNDHLIGNVYARFKYEEDAQAACDALNSRWYAARPIYCELSPVTDFREACCRLNSGEGCVRGGFCNFIHRKDPSPELDRELRLSTKKWLRERGRDARSVSRSPSPEPTRRRF